MCKLNYRHEKKLNTCPRLNNTIFERYMTSVLVNLSFNKHENLSFKNSQVTGWPYRLN